MTLRGLFDAPIPDGLVDRFGGRPNAITTAPDWTVRRLGERARMLGANGMRQGPDGRLYVAQAVGSQISAIDMDSGLVETIVPVDSTIIGPDDLAFDSHGTMFATEVLKGRVSGRTANGETRVLADGITAANGIAIHDDRIFVDEFRSGGRMWEIHRDGTSPRLIAEDLPFPNALELGEDGYLYFPVVLAGEIWRVPACGGTAERVVGGLASPVAVKFDAAGQLFAVNAGSGEIVCVDRQRRDAVSVARTRPGLDNLAFTADGRLFVSHFSDGGISELVDGAEHMIVQPSMLGPWGLALDGRGGIYVADGLSLARINMAGGVDRVATMLGGAFWPGLPRNVLIDAEGGIVIATTAGSISSYASDRYHRTLASGLGQIMGLALLPDGDIIACDAGEGVILKIGKGGISTLARGIGRPNDVAVHGSGALFVTDAAAGRVVKLDDGHVTTLAEGLIDPHGIALCGDYAYVADRGERSISEMVLASGARRGIATGLPLGRPGAELPPLDEINPHTLIPFTGLVCDGRRLFLFADGDGSVLILNQIKAKLQ